MAKPNITTRATKGSALTWAEGDTNLTNLRDATVSIKAGSSGTSVVSDLNGEITLVAGTNVTLTGDNTAKTITINSTASGGATNLDGLSDVVITTPATDNLLRFDGTNWVNTAASSISTGYALNVNLTADNTTNATNYPLFANTATGYSSPRTDTGFTYNPSTGVLTATSFAGAHNGTVGATTPSTGAFTTLSASSTVSGTGFSTYLASPPAIGGTTASTGAFTALTAKGASGLPKLKLDSTNISSPAWTTSGIGIQSGAVIYTDTSSTGTVAASYVNSFGTPAIASTNAITVTNATNLYLAEVSSGTNTTITNKYSLIASGSLKLNAQRELHFADSDSSNWVGFKAPATVSANKIWTLPAADGTINQVLTTDGAGNLSWSTAGSGGSGVTLAEDTTSTVDYLVFANSTSGSFSTLNTNGYLSYNAVNRELKIQSGSVTANYFTGAIGIVSQDNGYFQELGFKTPKETIVDLGTTGGTISPDVTLGSIQKITLNSALTINGLTNAFAGNSLTLIIYGGTSYTSITSTMKFAGGIKTLTGTAGCVDILTIFYDGTTYFASLGKGYA